MHSRSVVIVRRPRRRLFGTGAVLSAVLLWPFVQGPAARPTETVMPHLAATAMEGRGLRALFGSENRVIRTRERVIAVTFNAAWNDAGLDSILGALARRGAPATFFLTGDFAERHPAAVRRIAAAGHGLGNHSFSHPHFGDVGQARRRHEVRAADRALRAAGAGRALTPFFRFPYSETSPAHIREVNALGFADIEYTTDTNGWKGTEGGMSVNCAVERAVAALRPGTILQMHVGASRGRTEVIDAQALPRILDTFAARGYRVVDLRTLLTSDTARHHVSVVSRPHGNSQPGDTSGRVETRGTGAAGPAWRPVWCPSTAARTPRSSLR